MAEMTREEWLEARRSGVGASEAAIVLGCSPWKTALQLWMEKVDQSPIVEDDAKKRPWMTWGLKLEAIVAEEYRASTGEPIEKAPQLLRHPKHKFMLASLDYWIPDVKPVDIKCIFNQWKNDFGEEGTDEIPWYYNLQLQQQMAVTGTQEAGLVALHLGSWQVKKYIVERRDDVIESIVEAERDFWAMVEGGEPPLPDFEHPTTAQVLAALEPEPDTFDAIVDPKAARKAAQYKLLTTLITQASKVKERLKAELTYMMGGKEKVALADGRTVSRKKVKRAGYVVEPTTYQRFTVSKAVTDEPEAEQRIGEHLRQWLQRTGGSGEPEGVGVQSTDGQPKVSGEPEASPPGQPGQREDGPGSDVGDDESAEAV